MNDLSIAYKLKRHQPCRTVNIEFADAVVISFDRRDDKAFHLTNLREAASNLIRNGEIQCKAPGPASDLCGNGLGLSLVTTGDHDFVSASREHLSELSSETRGPPYNCNAALVRHTASNPLR